MNSRRPGTAGGPWNGWKKTTSKLLERLNVHLYTRCYGFPSFLVPFSTQKWYIWLFGTGNSKKHDAGWLFNAEKSHSSAAFVFFTANKWKCIAVCGSFPLKNGKTLCLSVLGFVGAVMKGVIGEPGEKNPGARGNSKSHGCFDIENCSVSRTGSAYSNEAFKGTGNACSLLNYKTNVNHENCWFCLPGA